MPIPLPPALQLIAALGWSNGRDIGTFVERTASAYSLRESEVREGGRKLGTLQLEFCVQRPLSFIVKQPHKHLMRPTPGTPLIAMGVLSKGLLRRPPIMVALRAQAHPHLQEEAAWAGQEADTVTLADLQSAFDDFMASKATVERKRPSVLPSGQGDSRGPSDQVGC